MPVTYDRINNIKRQDKVTLPSGTYEVAGKTRRADGQYEVTFMGGITRLISTDQLLKVEKGGLWSKNTGTTPGYMNRSKPA